jgi:hypothetical protein
LILLIFRVIILKIDANSLYDWKRKEAKLVAIVIATAINRF